MSLYSFSKSFLFAVGLFIMSCQAVPTTQVMEISDGWQVKSKSQTDWINANVPGTVHTDLLDAKKIKNPFYRLNEHELQWIDKEQWIYKTQFDISSTVFNHENIFLEFQGLDTYAKVYLNEHLILTSDNMFRKHSVPVNELLQNESNELRVEFDSPIEIGIDKHDKYNFLFPKSGNDLAEIGKVEGNKQVSIFTRKAGYHFGWDWGPRLVTSGIWKPITLNAWNGFRIEDVFINYKIENSKAFLTAKVEASASSSMNETEVYAHIKVGDEVIKNQRIELKEGSNNFEIDFEIKNPELWWPNGLGDQHLYDIEVRLSDQKSFDSKITTVGLREISLIRTPDSIGTSFYFKVNGNPVFMKGANYIPQDIFLTRPKREDYEFLLKSAKESNMNMIRVWGGGIYEMDEFYELCDEYGLLVWQDFMFACAVYPGDSAFLNSVKIEAVDNIKRLRNHPSIALWCGNNESLTAWENWGWKEQVAKDESIEIADSIWKSYEKLFHQILLDAVNTYDGGRPYWTSSPSSDFGIKESYESGDVHYWWVWWGKKPFEDYNEAIPRFMSEYGFQSFPEFSSVKRYTEAQDHHVYSEVMTSHQRSSIGNQTIEEYMLRDFNEPKDFPSFLYVSQLLQAHGLKIAIEAHRRHRDRCMGTLYWQLNDCWPVASWSSIDYYKKWKALHYRVKELFHPYLVSHEIQNEALQVYVVSDEFSPKEAKITLKLSDFFGKVLMNKSNLIEIKANQASIYQCINMNEIKQLGSLDEVFLAVQIQDLDGIILAENTIYFAAPKDLKLPTPNVDYRVRETESEFILELETNALAKNLHVSSELNNNFSNNYFDLLPGQPQIISIPKDASGDLNSFKSSIAIRTLIDSY